MSSKIIQVYPSHYAPHHGCLNHEHAQSHRHGTREISSANQSVAVHDQPGSSCYELKPKHPESKEVKRICRQQFCLIKLPTSWYARAREPMIIPTSPGSNTTWQTLKFQNDRICLLLSPTSLLLLMLWLLRLTTCFYMLDCAFIYCCQVYYFYKLIIPRHKCEQSHGDQTYVCKFHFMEYEHIIYQISIT